MTVPSDLPNLEFWVDAQDLSTLFQDAGKSVPVTSNGDDVGAWEDKSGNGRDVTQAVALKKPHFVENSINGRDSIGFGVANSEILTGPNALNSETTFTIFIVCTPLASRLGLPFQQGVSKVSWENNIDLTDLFYVNGTGAADGPSDLVINTGVYVSLVADGSNLTNYHYGTAGTPKAFSGNTGVNGLEIGGRDSAPAVYSDVYLGEIIIYSDELSDADRQAIESYLNIRWFVAVAGELTTPQKFIEDQGGAAAGGAGGAAGGNSADISGDGLSIYIAAFNSLGFPTVIKINEALLTDGSVVFNPGAGGRIGVQCGDLNGDIVWVAGQFDGTNTVEKSEDAGSSFTVKDTGAFGTIRTFQVGPSDDQRLLVFDGDNGDIIETLDDGETWTTINAAVTPSINNIARFGQNPEEIVAGNYSPNAGVNLEDYQTGVYPATDATKVIAN
jgi:hypothetical protein